MKRILIIGLLAISIFSCKKENKEEAFINDLMSKMTLEEKIGQMNLLTSDWDVTGPSIRKDYIEEIKRGNVGAMFNAFTAQYTRKLQEIAVKETRLHIPLMFGYDVIHGHRTIFPISLGESASWDLEAMETSARIAAIEAAAEGINWTFAPMVDIARDPRWGRVSEGAGEDTYLGSLIAKARVKGFQGDDLSKNNTIVACAKHYAAYGASQAGRDYHTVDISKRELWNTYLPPFKACVDAGCGTFMTSFNELDGVPSTANPYLLKDILRKQWGFKGFVVTDYTSINEMVKHGIAEDEKHAGELALNAGVDMDMQGSVYIKHLKTLLKEGKIKMEDIDNAVKSILTMKYRLGLFEDPYRYCDTNRQKALVMCKEHLEKAEDIASKSIVLLKNDNSVLPLKNVKKIALIGPMADARRDLIGSWSAAGDWKKSVTLLEGLKNKMDKSIQINYAQGCKIDSIDRSGFAKAVQVAKSSDVIILALGEAWYMSGEAASRSNINIPGIQTELLKELKKTGKPIILVLMNGRPLAIENEVGLSSAVLETWFLGTQAGNAIANVISGKVNPSGKLTITFPRNVGQIPIYYNMKNTGRPFDAANKYTSKYLDCPNEPLFPFGFGLSYSNFEYSNLKLDKSAISEKDSVTVSVTITNNSTFDGSEVVQLYVQDLVGSVTRPVKELKGFKKLYFEKGESKQVKFTIKPSDLAFYRADMSYGFEKGDFKIFVGTNSAKVLETKFSIK